MSKRSAKKANRARMLRLECEVQARENRYNYNLGLQEGIKRGRQQVEDDKKAKVIEARIKLLSVFGQSIQSMANLLDCDR